MRSPLVRALLPGAALAVAVSIAPAAAHSQGSTPFEGVVTFSTGQGRTMDYSIRQGLIRVDMNEGGQRAAMIANPAAREMYMVMPEQKMYMVMTMPEDKASAAQANYPEPTKTGRKEVVAGHECEYYRIAHEESETEVCLAGDMGAFRGFGGPMGNRKSPAWQKELGEKHFPLKVIATIDGKKEVVLEATKVERKKLPASLFAPPSSYRKMEMNMKMPSPGPR